MADLTRKALAKASGTAEGTVSRFERGQFRPDDRTFDDICAALEAAGVIFTANGGVAPADPPTAILDQTPREIAETAIEAALDRIQVTYWNACVTEKRAIDPYELGLDETEAALLREIYDYAMRIEACAASGGRSWEEAGQYFL